MHAYHYVYTYYSLGEYNGIMYSITLHALYSLYHALLHDLGVQRLCTLMMEM